MKFKHITNYAPGKDYQDMLLYTHIGDMVAENGEVQPGISGNYFAQEVKWLEEQGVKRLNVRINSVGGSIIDGFSIFSALVNSSMKVTTYIDGLGASMAGVIAMAGKKVVIKDYGLLMLHNPQGPKTTPQEQVILDCFKNSLVKIFEGRAPGLKERLGDIMDQETWIDATTALAWGLVDQVEQTGKKVDTTGPALKASNLYNVYNSLLTTPKKMSKLLRVLNITDLNTATDVVEEQAVAKIEALETENTELKNKLQGYKDAEELANAEAANKLELDAKAVVNEAVTDGRLEDKPEVVEAYVNTAKVAGLDTLKNMLGAITKVKPAVTITNMVNNTPVVPGEDRKDWTIRDWEKKDPKGLMEIKNTNPALYSNMYDSHYKKVK